MNVDYVLAIVGSTTFQKLDAFDVARGIINTHLDSEPILVVSGGAKGIDSLAKELAEARGIEVREHLPKNRRWAPAGFKERNILIAEDCDKLVRISCHTSKTYGSGWTADYAEKIGRQVQRYTL